MCVYKFFLCWPYAHVPGWYHEVSSTPRKPHDGKGVLFVCVCLFVCLCVCVCMYMRVYRRFCWFVYGFVFCMWDTATLLCWFVYGFMLCCCICSVCVACLFFCSLGVTPAGAMKATAGISAPAADRSIMRGLSMSISVRTRRMVNYA